MRKKQSLSLSLRRLAVIPLLCLGTAALLITTGSVYSSMVSETRDGLKNLAYSLRSSCTLMNGGDYTVSNNALYKGGKPFDADFSIVDDIKAVSGVDATIFFGDVRMITSIRTPDGVRAVNTCAADEVTQAVLKKGQDFFSDNVLVNGTPYFGYYTPLRGDSPNVVGMVFVGKARSLVNATVIKTISWIFFAVIAAVAITLTTALLYSKRIIFALHKTKEFLGCVAQGDSECKIDPYLLARNDEIGEMGRFAVILQKSISDLIGTDPLTGLNNRRSGEVILANAMREYQKYQTPFVLAIGDIDWFKNINDRYGHPAGDMVLKELSAIFNEHMGRKGFVSRWGGEEFLFLYERTEKQRALLHIDDLLSMIRTANICYCGQIIPITMTFGAAEFTDNTSIEEIIKQADNNLYSGKAQGKDRVCAAIIPPCQPAEEKTIVI